MYREPYNGFIPGTNLAMPSEPRVTKYPTPRTYQQIVRDIESEKLLKRINSRKYIHDVNDKHLHW